MRHVAEPYPRRRAWLRGLWPDRNPLRRSSDRLAAAIVAAALVTFLVGAPIAALGAGWWAQAAASQVARAQHASWRQVPAVLVAGAPSARARVRKARRSMREATRPGPLSSTESFASPCRRPRAIARRP